MPTNAETTRVAQDWRRLAAVFFVTSLVEGIGVSQMLSLLPAYSPGARRR